MEKTAHEHAVPKRLKRNTVTDNKFPEGNEGSYEVTYQQRECERILRGPVTCTGQGGLG